MMTNRTNEATRLDEATLILNPPSTPSTNSPSKTQSARPPGPTIPVNRADRVPSAESRTKLFDRIGLDRTLHGHGATHSPSVSDHIHIRTENVEVGIERNKQGPN